MSGAEPRIQVQDAWIWPEAGGVRWWTPGQTLTLALSTPWHDGIAPSMRALRDHGERLNPGVALAGPLATCLVSALGAADALRLHLSRDLPPDWQDCPFEWLTLDGQSLFGRLIVVRQAPTRFDPYAPLAPERAFAVLNLLASDEPIQPADALPDGAARIYDGLAAVEQWLAASDPTTLGVLAVVAHGTECDGERPFRLPDGRHWGLPLDRGLPPLIILLACGNDEGNLLVDGQRLLDAGAAAVLAPLGRPCPAAAGEFLAAFALAWRAGRRLDAILAEAQRPASAARGARLLRLLGRGDLRSSRAPDLAESSDARLVAAARSGQDEALAVLIDRLTLRALQQGGELDRAERDLRQRLAIGRQDEAGERWLGERLEAVSNWLWPLSRLWILPLETLLAEAYDHRRLPRLEAARAALRYDGIPISPSRHHAWSKLDYRMGRHALALREVARGLNGIGPHEWCDRGTGLLGHLVNLLIDVDLPAPAAVLYQCLDDCLAQRTDADAARERYQLHDRAARIALRQGQVERASAFYRLKRDESARQAGNGQRELAWLLYLESWRDPRGAASALADEVAAWLDGIEILHPDPGNADALYLLRAYAAWAWRGGQPAALERLEPCIGLLEERLFAGDAGPPGCALAYLHLCQRDDIARTLVLPPWERIATVLEAQRYFLELAAFEALLGARARVARLLDRVCAQRLWHGPPAFPDWLGDGVLLDWERLVTERAAVERRVLVEDSPSAEMLLASGLLPL